MGNLGPFEHWKHGEALASEALERIWESFYRADPSRTVPGTALAQEGAAQFFRGRSGAVWRTVDRDSRGGLSAKKWANPAGSARKKESGKMKKSA